MDMFAGSRNGYEWLSLHTSRCLMRSLLRAVPAVVLGRRVAVTSFDSGPLTPGEEEKAAGWFREGEVLWTSPITDSAALPCGEYDEWYVFADYVRLPPIEVFVNFSDLSLRELQPLLDANPTWDRRMFASALERQERFWAQISTLKPRSYFCENEALSFATADRQTFSAVRDWCLSL